MHTLSYEKKLKNRINTCGNTARVYILHGQPEIASSFARSAAHTAFILKPQLKEENSMLPTMENVAAERAAASGEAQAATLAERLRAPLPSISRTTGDIEKTSPLFRESSANPQTSLF
jgi:hypothetical protein